MTENTMISLTFSTYTIKNLAVQTTENVVGLLPVNQGLVQTYKFANL